MYIFLRFDPSKAEGKPDKEPPVGRERARIKNENDLSFHFANPFCKYYPMKICSPSYYMPRQECIGSASSRGCAKEKRFSSFFAGNVFCSVRCAPTKRQPFRSFAWICVLYHTQLVPEYIQRILCILITITNCFYLNIFRMNKINLVRVD